MVLQELERELEREPEREQELEQRLVVGAGKEHQALIAPINKQI